MCRGPGLLVARWLGPHGSWPCRAAGCAAQAFHAPASTRSAPVQYLSAMRLPGLARVPCPAGNLSHPPSLTITALTALYPESPAPPAAHHLFRPACARGPINKTVVDSTTPTACRRCAPDGSWSQPRTRFRTFDRRVGPRLPTRPADTARGAGSTCFQCSATVDGHGRCAANWISSPISSPHGTGSAARPMTTSHADSSGIRRPGPGSLARIAALHRKGPSRAPSPPVRHWHRGEREPQDGRRRLGRPVRIRRAHAALLRTRPHWIVGQRDPLEAFGHRPKQVHRQLARVVQPTSIANSASLNTSSTHARDTRSKNGTQPCCAWTSTGGSS